MSQDEETTKDNSEEGCCSQCLQRSKGFLTDREQRKFFGMGILYLFAFPILILMIVIGAIKAAPPGEENPNCPAEPNMPWFLVTGGSFLSLFLVIRIILNKLTRYIKNRQDCCDHVTGCFCEFGCNLVYDILVMVMLIMWMITVTWWVARHYIGPDTLYSILGKEGLDNFRASLGDNDTIHNVQWTQEDQEDYCDQLLYLVTFSLLMIGWVVLVVTFLVFLADKIFNKLLCCSLCSSINNKQDEVDNDEERVQLKSSRTIEY